MYYILINRKTYRILATADTETDIAERMEIEIKYLESRGQQNPGFYIETRNGPWA